MVVNDNTDVTDSISSSGVRLNSHRHKLKHRYDILRKLGQGTYGKVQLGINKITGQEVAIKTIKKAKIETEQDLIRIRREIQIMSSVQHPNIIHIFEVFENRERIVLVMEFAAGGELYDYLITKKILSEEEARRIFRQIAAAVYYCHKHNICHRDLKLENILMDESGNCKIADFGLSNVYDGCSLLSTFCGSPLYASPEIVKGIPYYGPEVDCWSLGVLLYTLAYGSMPFDGSNFKRLVKQICSGEFYEPENPSSSSELIHQMLTINTKQRANIEDICSHWWVNLGYEDSCLEIAENLACQTPVRLDILLQLAPPPTKEDLVMGGEDISSSGNNNSVLFDSLQDSKHPENVINEDSMELSAQILSENEILEQLMDFDSNINFSHDSRDFKVSSASNLGLSDTLNEEQKIFDEHEFDNFENPPSLPVMDVIENENTIYSYSVEEIKENNCEAKFLSEDLAVIENGDISESSVTKFDELRPDYVIEIKEIQTLHSESIIETLIPKEVTASEEMKTCAYDVDNTSMGSLNNLLDESATDANNPLHVMTSNMSVLSTENMENQSSELSTEVADMNFNPTLFNNEILQPCEAAASELSMNNSESVNHSKISNTKESACIKVAELEKKTPKTIKRLKSKTTSNLTSDPKGEKNAAKAEEKIAKSFLRKPSKLIKKENEKPAPRTLKSNGIMSMVQKFAGPESHSHEKPRKVTVIPRLTDVKKNSEAKPLEKRSVVIPALKVSEARKAFENKNERGKSSSVIQSAKHNTIVDSAVRSGIAKKIPEISNIPQKFSANRLARVESDVKKQLPFTSNKSPLVENDLLANENVSYDKNVDKNNETLAAVLNDIQTYCSNYNTEIIASPSTQNPPSLQSPTGVKQVILELAPNITKLAAMEGDIISKEDISLPSTSIKNERYHHIKSHSLDTTIENLLCIPFSSNKEKIVENKIAKQLPNVENKQCSYSQKNIVSDILEKKIIPPDKIKTSKEVYHRTSSLPRFSASKLKVPLQKAEISLVVNAQKASPSSRLHSEKIIPIFLEDSKVNLQNENNSLKTSPINNPAVVSTVNTNSSKEYIIPIALENGGYAVSSNIVNNDKVHKGKNDQNNWLQNLESFPNKNQSLFDNLRMKDIPFMSKDVKSVGSLQRLTSFGKRDSRLSIPFGQNSKQKESHLESVDSISSAGEDDDDDDDGFQILTAESLFSTLLSRVRSMTRCLSQDETEFSSFLKDSKRIKEVKEKFNQEKNISILGNNDIHRRDAIIPVSSCRSHMPTISSVNLYNKSNLTKEDKTSSPIYHAYSRTSHIEHETNESDFLHSCSPFIYNKNLPLQKLNKYSEKTLSVEKIKKDILPKYSMLDACILLDSDALRKVINDKYSKNSLTNMNASGLIESLSNGHLESDCDSAVSSLDTFNSSHSSSPNNSFLNRSLQFGKEEDIGERILRKSYFSRFNSPSFLVSHRHRRSSRDIPGSSTLFSSPQSESLIPHRTRSFKCDIEKKPCCNIDYRKNPKLLWQDHSYMTNFDTLQKQRANNPEPTFYLDNLDLRKSENKSVSSFEYNEITSNVKLSSNAKPINTSKTRFHRYSS